MKKLRGTAIVLLTLLLPLSFVFSVRASLHGDVDGDSQISSADARSILRFAVQAEIPNETTKALADLDADGIISSADARTALRIAVGLPAEVIHSYTQTHIQDGYERYILFDCGVCGHSYRVPIEQESSTEAVTEKPTDPAQETTTENLTEAETSTEKEEVTTEKEEVTTEKEEVTTLAPDESTTDGQSPEVGENFIKAGGKTLLLGSSLEKLSADFGTSYERDDTVKGYDCYIFYGDYNSFFMAFMKEGTARAYYVLSKGFETSAFKEGDTVQNQSTIEISSDCIATLFADENNNSKLYAALIRYKDVSVTANLEADDFYAASSKQIFHLTNAFRTYHGQQPLIWSQAVAQVALSHSADMAANNYFAHENLANESPAQRASKAGISYRAFAENIAAGNSLSYRTFNQWVNSAGHRTSMLSAAYTHLGVGGAFSAQSTYRYYWTQNFMS